MSRHCMIYVVRREGTPDLFDRRSWDRIRTHLAQVYVF